MFAEAGDDRDDKQQSASAAATDQVKLWETIIGLRISLQRSIDTSNKLPNAGHISHTVRGDQSGANQLAEVKDGLKGLVGDLNHLLEIQTEGSSSAKKRKVNDEIKWDDIAKIQQKLRPSWESTVNKWHARLHFGSEQMKSKMKVFNQTIWEQIDVALEDENRVIEKSRMSWDESGRLDKEFDEDGSVIISGDNSVSNGDVSTEEGNILKKNEKRKFDSECYDDRPFYSMLLKTFITSASGAASGQGAQGMNSEDLIALRKYRKNKINVDRKASKGRKIRYTRHPKLENFMFPVVRSSVTSAFRSDGDRKPSDHIKDGGGGGGDGVQNSFFRSLFQ